MIVAANKHRFWHVLIALPYFVFMLATLGCAHKRVAPSPPIAPEVVQARALPAPPPPKPRPIKRPRYHGFRILLPVRRIVITQRFYNTAYREHPGIDLAGYRGEPIYAAHRGIVVYAGTGFRGYGKMIIIEFNKKWATLYAHLNWLRVRTGWHVRAGERIGSMGRTGNATGVHLHFELLLNKLPIDPLPYLERALRTWRRRRYIWRHRRRR